MFPALGQEDSRLLLYMFFHVLFKISVALTVEEGLIKMPFVLSGLDRSALASTGWNYSTGGLNPNAPYNRWDWMTADWEHKDVSFLVYGVRPVGLEPTPPQPYKPEPSAQLAPR